MTKIITTIIVLIIGYLILQFVWGLIAPKGNWVGLHYKDASFPGKYTLGPEFSEKDYCIQWGEKQVAQYGGLYDCGRGCNRTEYGLFLCNETVNYQFNHNL